MFDTKQYPLLNISILNGSKSNSKIPQYILFGISFFSIFKSDFIVFTILHKFL